MNNTANPSDTDILQRILTLAALFDCEFSINWLQELSREKPQLILEALDLGLKKKWTRSKRPGFYFFNDSEEQTRLKESLPPKERETLHRRITDILLQETLEDPEKKGILARSLLNIENDVDGCRRLLAEGKSIARQNREPEAVGYYAKAIEDLGRLNGEEAERLLLDTTIEYAGVSMTELETLQVISVIRGALEWAKNRSFLPQQALLNMYLAVYEFFRSEFSSAQLNYQEGLNLSKEITDEKFKRAIHLLSALFLFHQGQYREALDLFEEFVPEIDRVPHGGVPTMWRPLHGSCLAYCGQTSQGLGMVRATINIGRKLKGSLVTGWSEFLMGRICVETGRFSEAVEALESALEKAEDGNHSQFKVGILMFLSYANHKLGRNKPAIATLMELRKTKNLSQRTNPFPMIMHLCWSMDRGKLPRLDGFDLERNISDALQSPNVYMKGMAYRYKALIAKREGRPIREVIDEYNQALKWLEISGHQIGISEIKLELAWEYLELGDEKQARAMGDPAIKFLLSINRNLVPKALLHLEKELRTSEEMLKEIFRLGQELVTIRDNRKLVGRIISTANRLTGAERGAIFLLEKDPDRMVLRASKNLTSEDAASPGFKDSMKIIMETTRSGKGQAIEFESPLKEELSSGVSVGACICVPMILRNSAFGVLYHDHFDSQKGFKNADLEVLNFFAAQAAIAMDNAQAYKALEEMVEKQQEKSRYFEEQYLEHQSFENIVGKSPAIQQVFHHIESVAETDTTVLVLGETGVGKELVARAIHRHSPRKDKPFIRVNCSAFTENLITSELFGHEKGAFTGAFDRSIGRFELADGGTLFLDEIGDIPAETQVRLLRVLQSKEFERVGGHETLRSDFRLLAATNRDLEKEAQAGRFRQDLFFRLNVFPIRVPALKERKEDIPLLAYHFLNTNAKKLGKTIETILESDLEVLKAYHWPGNIRELENIIERGVILSSGPNLQVPDAGFKIPDGNLDSAITTLEEMERTHILRTLKKTGGQLAGPGGAAEILNINPSTLRHRMKKLGIQKSDWTFVYAQNE
ncbi:MAG: GAF domain-containing protein [Proteobacteria bacterium]|nr:GAF domain-containing protein [Pseudomonadota bacterium]